MGDSYGCRMDGGAHYIKADLQVHTPRDPGWTASITGDEDRRQFAREFVVACRGADLGAVAITDHHDFGFVPYIREAAEQEVGTDGNPVDLARRLVIFPGLELTLSVPCQCLVIFSADFPTDQLSNVLITLGIEPAEAADAKAKQPEQLDMTLEGLHARLDGVQVAARPLHRAAQRHRRRALHADAQQVPGALPQDAVRRRLSR